MKKLRKLVQLNCRDCGFVTEVNPESDRHRPKYCSNCGAVILAARASKVRSEDIQPLETRREGMDTALRVLQRVLGESTHERIKTLRSMKGLEPREIRQACEEYRRRKN